MWLTRAMNSAESLETGNANSAAVYGESKALK